MKKHYSGAVYELNQTNMQNLIEQLEVALSENERLREALKVCEDVAYSYDQHPKGFEVVFCTAKQALAETGDE